MPHRKRVASAVRLGRCLLSSPPARAHGPAAPPPTFDCVRHTAAPGADAHADPQGQLQLVFTAGSHYVLRTAKDMQKGLS